jgi:hypothetical protein
VHISTCSFRSVPLVSRFLSALACACRVMSRQLRHCGLLAPRQHRGATRLAALHFGRRAVDTSSPWPQLLDGQSFMPWLAHGEGVKVEVLREPRRRFCPTSHASPCALPHPPI